MRKKSVNVVFLFIFCIIIRMTQINTKSSNIAFLQEEIIRQYKRLSFGQSSKFQDFLQTPYSPLPPYIPEDLHQNVQKCIVLQNCSCFETMTFALMEYIFCCDAEEQKRLIDKVRSTICDENFLFGSGTIKGLLIKGLQSIIQHRNSLDKPIANWLKEMDCLEAFSEFWKQLIEEQSEGEVHAFTTEPEPIYFKHVSNYIGVGFKLNHSSEKQMRQIIIDPKGFSEKGHLCSIYIRRTPQQQSSILQGEPAANEPIEYTILCERERQISQQQGQVQIPLSFVSPSQRSQDLILLKAKIWEVKQRGRQLIRSLRQFEDIINES